MTRQSKSTVGGGTSTAEKHWDEKWEPLRTEYRDVDPKDLVPREVNARYMEPAEFRRLVENLKKDGKLTSVPLCCLLPDGRIELLSGHHRRLAAIEAGFKTIKVEVILNELSEDRKNAIQLSHNAISGKDNPSILQQMWAGLSLDAKKFSGLTEDDIGKFSDIKIDGIAAASLKYDEVSLMFLPMDREIFEQALKHLDGSKKKIPHIHVAHAEAFSVFFDAVVNVKEKRGVNNSALAIVTMAELAMERLAQIEAEEAEQAAEQEQPAAAKKGKRK